ncbi:MAG: LOG family protein [Planctomycetaceae bacterium]|jgi:uncharacterized protein (TIGR00730 family)|nr:LOG family protein [Planctomycetaceae bacterium]
MQNITIPFDESFEKPTAFTDLPDSADDSVFGDVSQHLSSPSYELAFRDANYIMSDCARGVRLQMEMDKPEWFFRHCGIRSTVIVFGSARFVSRNKAERLLSEARDDLSAHPRDPHYADAVTKAELLLKTSVYYETARRFAYIVSKEANIPAPVLPAADRFDSSSRPGPYDYVICTGGGPGVMEAANRGASEAGAMSIGLNITLPYEQKPNPYTTPHLCFQFHYFNVRKLHFMLRAKAVVACAGGFGTFDELFEALTLRQTERMQKIPIVLLGTEFWHTCVNFDYLVDTGVINRGDLELFHITDDPQKAWDVIQAFYRAD